MVKLYLLAFLFCLGALSQPYWVFEQPSPTPVVRVMTYPSFTQKWGPGPEIARKFKAETGLTIQWINGGHGGLLLERLKFRQDQDQTDMLMGLDQFDLHEARQSFHWQPIGSLLETLHKNLLPKEVFFQEFLPYDWGAMAFVMKKKALASPKRLMDLLDPSYEGKIILQDPRMSSPGLQFLFWVLMSFGEEKGFEFLKKLKPSIKIMASSWSSSYSLFTMEQPTMVFSYVTSPLYHMIEEQDDSYQAVLMKNPHPLQMEFAAIPSSCKNCEGARKLAQFLLRKDIQQILMEKNYMWPVEGEALKSPFEKPQGLKFLAPLKGLSLSERKKELVNQWKSVFY